MPRTRTAKGGDPLDAILQESRRSRAADSAPGTAPSPSRRKAAAAGHRANHALAPDAAMAAMIAKASEASGGKAICSSKDAEALICGLELPSLSVRYLFRQDVLPLSRALMIWGDPGSCKSAFLHELYRWTLLHSGLCVHIDNEGKDSPDLRNSILGYDPSMMARVPLEETNSQQEWMAAVQKWVRSYDLQYARVQPTSRVQKKRKEGETAEEYKKRTAAKVVEGNPGYIYPLLIGLDSITATSSDSTIQGIRDSGAPKRRYQEEAMLLSDFAKILPDLLRSRPMLLATINHRKDKVNEQTGAVTDRVPGGAAMRFMDTTELKLQRIGAPIKMVDRQGLKIGISMPKNSLGVGQGRLEVDFLWDWVEDPETGEPMQRTVWDWEAATIRMLLDQKKEGAARWAALREIVDLDEPRKGFVSSRALKIPAAKPVRLTEAGTILEQEHPDLVEALRKLLRIKKRTKFRPGLDYAAVRAGLEQNLEDRRPVYAPRDLADLADIADALDETAQAAAKAEARKAAVAAAVEADEDEEDDGPVEVSAVAEEDEEE